MENRTIYLDNNASTQPIQAVQDAMLDAMNAAFGNASSAHRSGEKARRLIALSRDRVASILGARPNQIFFTSGATESNNWVIRNARKNGRVRVITTPLEHSSILSNNSASTMFSVASNGRVDPAELAALSEESTNLVSIHWVNNETGVIQPIEELAMICQERQIPLHVDASQAVGKLPINLGKMEISFLSLAAHKFHGPQGIGALYVRDPSNLARWMSGGTQEHGLRPGTENLPGIAGFGVAAQVREDQLDASITHMAMLRDEFEKRVLTTNANVKVNGCTTHRVCNTTNLLFEGVNGQALVAQLDAAGVRCSQSSACTSQIPEPSNVLRAMGLTEEQAYSSVRFSFSQQNNIEEVGTAAQLVTERVKALRENIVLHEQPLPGTAR